MSTIKSLLIKLAMVLVILVAWMAYHNHSLFDSISLSSLSGAASDKLPKRLTKPSVTITTVYKWKDSNGTWQFSGTPPVGVTDFTVETIRSDQNVIASEPAVPPATQQATKEKTAVTPGKSEGSDSSTGATANPDSGGLDSLLSPERYKQAIEQAKEARRAMEQRNQTQEQLLK
ncbi:MAG: DUF4124 domain-containing protein [Gammaproteobacteria bacterium]|nr:DUF4124 domain-containing protein [Gammaproteobacteria bacterium]